MTSFNCTTSSLPHFSLLQLNSLSDKIPFTSSPFVKSSLPGQEAFLCLLFKSSWNSCLASPILFWTFPQLLSPLLQITYSGLEGKLCSSYPFVPYPHPSPDQVLSASYSFSGAIPFSNVLSKSTSSQCLPPSSWASPRLIYCIDFSIPNKLFSSSFSAKILSSSVPILLQPPSQGSLYFNDMITSCALPDIKAT